MPTDEKKKSRIIRLIVMTAALFLVLSGAVLFGGARFVKRQFLLSNQNIAMDIALLVKNNFSITDAEVEYMKGLTFNEMEVDPINLRLMNVGDDVKLSAKISNVYLVAALEEDEIKHVANGEAAEFLGFADGTPLDGIWLLNGKIGEDGRFVPTQRDDIYRYTYLDDEIRRGIADKVPFSTYSSDAWGNFITGYAPVYTVEGNFVGLLGIDMDPDRYQQSAQNMIFTLIAAFSAAVLVVTSLFVLIYIKYYRMRGRQLEFDLYSDMSHDLRTPMNAILGMAEISRDETNPAVLRENFEKVETSGRYMLALINDALDRRDSDPAGDDMKIEFLPLSTVISAAADIVRPLAAGKDVEFLAEAPVSADRRIKADQIKLRQVLVCLLTTAVRAEPSGGKVTLIVKRGEAGEGTDRVTFTVSDTRAGIAGHTVSRKHKRHDYDPETEIALAKRLSEAMGGSVSVTGLKGGGEALAASFVFPAEGGEGPHRTEATKALDGRKVLLCEDNRVNAEITSRLLGRAGCAVETAENGRIGVDMFAGSECGYYDAVLMDIRMPVMDGLEAARAIRALSRPDARSVPVIALTANAYEEDRRHSREAGMNAHLAKPVDPVTLITTIEKLVLRG